MFKIFALCLMAIIALASAAPKPGIVAPLAYSAPLVAAPYAAAYTAPYAAAYTAYSAYPYAGPYVAAAPYAAAYSAYPYASPLLLRK